MCCQLVKWPKKSMDIRIANKTYGTNFGDVYRCCCDCLPATLFPQPALFVRIEECVHEVVTIVLWYLERLRTD